MAQEHRDEYALEWTAMSAIVPKVCCTAETPWRWVQQSEHDAEQAPGL
jgi:hypothetical protein